MRLLVLGGSEFVGAAVVAAARALGHEVTTLNRGRRPAPPGVRALIADRNDPMSVAAALRGASFDAVVDVSGMSARQVRTTSDLLADRVGRILLVSTVSVHPGFPEGDVTEDSPVVAADPDDPAEPDLSRYAEQKAGGEYAALRAFGPDRTLILRPGIILGPAENVGRIDYWAARASGRQPFLAPGDPDRAFQVADSRDLAEWGLAALAAGRSGPYLAVAPFGRDTFGSFIHTALTAGGGGAEPRWVPDEPLLRAGVAPWSGIPMWLPGAPGAIRTHRIEDAGYRARPLSDTVAASLAWWESHPSHARPGRGGGSITAQQEADLLQRLAESH